MNYSEDHIALAAEYALGTLDADERALVDTMMIVDHGFRDVVAAWDRKLGPLQQMVEPIEPPAHVWDKVQAAVRVVVAEAAAARPPEPVVVPEVLAPTVETPVPVVPPVEEKPVAETPPPEIAPVVVPEIVTQPAEAPSAPELLAVPEKPPVSEQPVSQPSPNVIVLPERRRGGLYSALVTALAACLAAIVALQAYRPDLLPEKLRIKPQVQIVRVAPPAAMPPAQFVGILQQNPASPAFILTVDSGTKYFTVRRLTPPSPPGKSYELWIVSDKLPGPRSLGVVGGSDFTIRAALTDYDQDSIRKSTYAITIEPQGGSPTGAPTGTVIYSGRLVESVPTIPTAH